MIVKSQGRRLGAEVVHVLQPVAHLALLGLCGPASWTPLLASLGLDLASLALHRTEEAGTVEDEAEMARRRLALLLYLLRSPLYEAGSRAVLVSGLQFSRDNIPLVARLGLAEAMLKYLHEYQEMYFYTWAS